MSAARTVTFKGSNILTLLGAERRVGEKMPALKLVANDMSDFTEQQLAGKKIIISVVPSLDTPVCSIQTKRFNADASTVPNVAVLTVSLDLPFAQKRWCGAEGVKNVITASDYKYRGFGENFGCYLKEWGLLSRAIFVVDSKGVIQHVEYVPEISSEPNYEAALSAAKKAA